jgi:hypothetical protein
MLHRAGPKRRSSGASAVGFNGSQMRKKIDKVIDRTEERSREIDKGAAGAQPK